MNAEFRTELKALYRHPVCCEPSCKKNKTKSKKLLQRCGTCAEVFGFVLAHYCSRKCQAKDWKKHRLAHNTVTKKSKRCWNVKCEERHRKTERKCSRCAFAFFHEKCEELSQRAHEDECGMLKLREEYAKIHQFLNNPKSRNIYNEFQKEYSNLHDEYDRLLADESHKLDCNDFKIENINKKIERYQQWSKNIKDILEGDKKPEGLGKYQTIYLIAQVSFIEEDLKSLKTALENDNNDDVNEIYCRFRIDHKALLMMLAHPKLVGIIPELESLQLEGGKKI